MVAVDNDNEADPFSRGRDREREKELGRLEKEETSRFGGWSMRSLQLLIRGLIVIKLLVISRVISTPRLDRRALAVERSHQKERMVADSGRE